MTYRTKSAIVAVSAAWLMLTPLWAAPPTAPQATGRLTLLASRLFGATKALAGSSAISASLAPLPVMHDRALRLAATSRCQPRPTCITDAYLWTQSEIDGVAAQLERGALPGQQLGAVIAGLRRSSAYARYHSLTDRAMLAAIWRDEAKAFNRIIQVYGQGAAPRYPKIDSITFDPKAAEFAGLIDSLDATIKDVQSRSAPFDAALAFATALLDLNGRDDAVRFEPLDAAENAPAMARAAKTDWGRFRYTALLVPGDGPEAPDQPLGSLGKLRLMAAAKRWHDGLAPFIIVSGGSVHPANTRFNEAIEMRRELIAQYRIPASAIIVEPYARHTTTNIRNAARLMIRYHMPIDRDGLIVTSESQSRYIETAVFAARCRDELGYLPMALGQRLSNFDVAFRPSTLSLQIDFGDPLDP